MKSEIEKFYDNTLKPATVILASAFASGGALPVGELSEQIFQIVLKYAEKACNDYRYGMFYFDEDSSHMEAKIKSVAMCLETNRLLGVKMSRDHVTDLVLMALFRINTAAVDYEERHEFLGKFVDFGNIYPVSDLMYALVIIVFTVYMQYLLSLRASSDAVEFDGDGFCEFINSLDMLCYERVYIMIDEYVQIHRKSVVDK